MRSVDIRVAGRVQGVFFRLSTRNRAVERGVRGTVRNEPDGTVTIAAEAEDAALDLFLEWVRHGPTRARVDSVSIVEREERGFEGFEVTG